MSNFKMFIHYFLLRFWQLSMIGSLMYIVFNLEIIGDISAYITELLYEVFSFITDETLKVCFILGFILFNIFSLYYYIICKDGSKEN